MGGCDRIPVPHGGFQDVNSWYCMHAARSMYCVLRVSKAICQAITFAPMQDGELCYSCSSHRQLNSGKY